MKKFVLFLVFLFFSNQVLALERDKELHFYAGLTIGGLSYIGIRTSTWNSQYPESKKIIFAFSTGIVTSVITGATKELVWDKMLNKGKAEWKDFAATSFGGFVGSLTMLCLDKVITKKKKKNACLSLQLLPKEKSIKLVFSWVN